MIKKVFDYIEKYHMLSPGDVVVTGVSGGADSVCLLRVLIEIQKKIPFSIHVVHVNHLIREEAGVDERFVEELCKNYQIPYHVVHEDVESIAEQKHITTEEAGREVRYETFEEILAKVSNGENGKIAIAHNKNDSAETVLFHLFRGSGIRGLTGILPVRNHIIRPLLCLERNEIEAYLEMIGQSFCTDATNLTDDYARNRIRHHVLQFAQDEICSGAVANTQNAAEKMADLNEFLKRMSQKAYGECAKEQQNKGIFINAAKLQEQDKVLYSYIFMIALEKLVNTRKDISTVHVEDIQNLLNKQAGKHIDLPYGLEACREYEGILLRRKMQNKEKSSTSMQQSKTQLLEEELVEGKIYSLQINALQTLEYGLFPYDGKEEIPEKTYTKWFDYDKIIMRLSIRKRSTGDYLIVNDKNQKQSLKSFFINGKFPREERDEIDLLSDGNHIVWIIGSRISSYYKVGKDTKRILKVSLRGGVEDG